MKHTKTELTQSSVKIMLKISKILILILLNLALTKDTSFAQEDKTGFLITPSNVHKQIKQGETIKIPISISNNHNTPVHLGINFKAFKGNERGDLMWLNNNDSRWNDYQKLFRSLQVQENNKPIEYLTVLPHQEKKVVLIIPSTRVKNKSDYYFSILFTSVSPGEQLASIKNYSRISIGAACNVLLSVGNKQEQAKVTIKTFKSPSFIPHPPVPFEIILENISNNFTIIHGEVSLMNMFNQPIGKIPIAPHTLLGSSKRVILDKQNQIVWNENLILGVYKAILSIRTQEGITLTKTACFTAIPYNLILYLLLLLIACIYVVKRIKKNNKNN